MSFQRPHWRRPVALQRPTRTSRAERSNKTDGRDASGRPSRTRSRVTRRRRIWDLARHIPAFLARFLRLVAFVALLLPAFVVFAWHYATCDRVARYYGGRCIDDDGRGFDSSNGGVRDGDGDGGRAKTRGRGDPIFSRHYLDVYGSRTPPPEGTAAGRKKPVVIFLTGGAWIIGYRMWGALLARALVPHGVLVVIPDYRNFPRVDIGGMVRDADASIQWTLDHAEEYGGDGDGVVLVGQSAGAHVGGVVIALKVLDWMRRRRPWAGGTGEDGETVYSLRDSSNGHPLLRSTYSPRQLRGFVSTSAPHNLVTMRPVFHRHGLSASVQRSIFGGIGDDSDRVGGLEEVDVFERWSPYHLVRRAHEECASMLEGEAGEGMTFPELKDVFPRLCVIHGTADKTVPLGEAAEFASLLERLGMPAETRFYEGWSHTDPILEAPMRGNHRYHRDVYELVRRWTDDDSAPPCLKGERDGRNHTAPAFDDTHPKLRPICPSALVEAARFCNPF